MLCGTRYHLKYLYYNDVSVHTIDSEHPIALIDVFMLDATYLLPQFLILYRSSRQQQ